MSHNYQDLIGLFEQTFYANYRTKLIKGDDEPIYLPANEQCPYHQIVFAHGYFSSALHEIAHWCIAGAERRLQEDFGYWYIPDGRTAEQQQTFEQVEIKPQAIEWAFCQAAKKKFYVSADNLHGAQADTTSFKHHVYQQVKQYLQTGFPPRAQMFIEALARFYHVELPLTIEQFQLDKDLCTDV
ncbi:elongation factor P hydroxylase [Thalassotalea sp. G2M2-11]|uniref:elongation factor P hydroxylase n=1 Tax=Thalassotalea sp. G2M2-11 TaxID=2787627 RepID=UPI0019D02637|nr:elongation factor P hydroxylase [Thalassotalea sp. G2M2-11]